jgi:hypothetical protein
MMSATDALVNVHDTPTLMLKVTRGTRHEYDVPGLLGILGALELAHTRTRPYVWKRHLGLTSAKSRPV